MVRSAVVRLAALAPVVLGVAAAQAAEPGCRAEAMLEPRRAVVGQQVLYRVRVLRRDDVVRVEWAEPPVFASMRSEALPPEPRSDTRQDGILYHVHDELRALFAERSGHLALRGATLRCETAAGPAQNLLVPAVDLEVVPFPVPGQPQGFTGLVGPVLLDLTVTPDRVALGESVRVALMVRGPGNLWLLDAPFPASAFADAEVFARPPELALERGRALYLRQHIVLDVVPRSAGWLRIPALRVPFFDPEGGVYREAATQEVEVMVEERAAGTPTPGRHAGPAAAQARPPAGMPARGWILALAAAGLLTGGTVAWRRRRRTDAAAQALSEAAQARAAGDPAGELAALGRALRAALARHVPGAAALSAEELLLRAARPASREAAALLAALERARFRPGAAAPGVEQVARAVRALGAGRAWRRAARPYAALFALGLASSGPLASGCAGTGEARRDAPMTPARLEAALREEAPDLEVVGDQLRFTYGGVRMVCVHDLHADRMRIVAAVAEESALTVASARILLEANFGQTLDSRYAIRDGVLYAVYLHPLSTLAPRDLEAALSQVARLVRNFGSTYSAGR